MYTRLRTLGCTCEPVRSEIATGVPRGGYRLACAAVRQRLRTRRIRETHSCAPRVTGQIRPAQTPPWGAKLGTVFAASSSATSARCSLLIRS